MAAVQCGAYGDSPSERALNTFKDSFMIGHNSQWKFCNILLIHN